MYLTPTNKHWVIDIETDDLKATRIWVAGVENVVTKEKRRLVGHEEIKVFVDNHPDAYWITHNGLEFDVYVLNRLLKINIPVTRVVDTYVLSQLYFPKLPGGHSLEAWAKRVGLEKGNFKDFTRYSEEMAKYCAQDARITAEVFLRLSRRMRDIGFSEIGCSVEHRAWAIIRQQRRNGFAFDVKRAGLLFAEIREEQAKLKEKIYARFPPILTCVGEFKCSHKRDGSPTKQYLVHEGRFPRIEAWGEGGYRVFDWVEFNLGSPPQRVEKLIALGWKPREFTKITEKGGGGNPKATDGGELVPSLLEFVEESGVEEVRLIAQWMALEGRANAVGNWMDLYDEHTGAIHGNLWIASSLRYRHDKPNTANIPSVRHRKDGSVVKGIEGYYTYEARALWTHRGGAERKLVGVDAKSMQMRNLAHWLDDKAFTDAVLAADPHSVNRDNWGFTPDDNGRRLAKTLYYAIVMGAGDARVSSEAKISLKEAKAAKKMLFDKVPGFSRLLNQLKREQQQTGRITLISGNKVVVPKDYRVIPYLLQGDESQLMKLAAIYIQAGIDKEKLDVLKVGDVHDEFIFDVAEKDVEAFVKLLPECFRRAGEFFKYKVPIDCSILVGDTWAEVH